MGADARRASKGAREPAPEGDAPDTRITEFTFGGESFLVISVPQLSEGAMSGLTEAERAVVAGLVEGRSNAEIAARRGTSSRTVANQVASIFRKLGVGSRAELVALVVKDEGEGVP